MLNLRSTKIGALIIISLASFITSANAGPILVRSTTAIDPKKAECQAMYKKLLDQRNTVKSILINLDSYFINKSILGNYFSGDAVPNLASVPKTADIKSQLDPAIQSLYTQNAIYEVIAKNYFNSCSP